MKNHLNFNKFILISVFFHVLVVLMATINEPEKKNNQIIIEFKTNKLEPKNISTSKNIKTKNRYSKRKKINKSYNLIKKPKLIQNIKIIKLHKDKKKQISPIIPIIFNKSDYQVKSFSINNKKSLNNVFNNTDYKNVNKNNKIDLEIKEDSKIENINNDIYQNTSHEKNGYDNNFENFNWKGKSNRKLISRGKLVMPEYLKNKGIRARVVLFFKVDSYGRPMGLFLHISSGYTDLDNEVIKYTRTFRFDRIDVKYNYEVEFTQIFEP